MNAQTTNSGQMKLPPASTAPLGPAARSAALPGAERRLVDELVGTAGLFGLVRTDTKIDVGKWFRKRRICACLLGDQLLLVAEGRRPYTERIALAELRESRYNHVTGQLVFAPAEGLRQRSLKMSPLAGLQMLAQIYFQQG